jgi:hypothetical protein
MYTETPVVCPIHQPNSNSATTTAYDQPISAEQRCRCYVLTPLGVDSSQRSHTNLLTDFLERPHIANQSSISMYVSSIHCTYDASLQILVHIRFTQPSCLRRSWELKQSYDGPTCFALHLQGDATATHSCCQGVRLFLRTAFQRLLVLD